MKITANDLILLSYLMLTTFCSVTLEDEKQLSITHKFHQSQKVPLDNQKKSNPVTRNQRQSTKRRKTEQPGLLIAITSLLGGTVTDTFTAYRNISRLVGAAFAPPNQTTTTGSNTSAAPANGTTFTLRQALGLLGRNYRGLRRLFDNEFTKALNESYKNALDFRRELKNSARMFLEYDGANNTIR